MSADRSGSDPGSPVDDLNRIPDQLHWKQVAGERAAEQVQDGMIVCLGTGSTAEEAIRALARRVQDGLSFTGVPSSLRTERLARSLGLTLADILDVDPPDLTIDGADQVVPATLNVLKGRGGALLREKLVALDSLRVLLIVDESKIVERLGPLVPVEVVPFAWHIPHQELEALGFQARLRQDPESGRRFVTDNGNFIFDVETGPIDDPRLLATEFKQITGVVEHGLFIDMVDEVIVAGPSGVRTLSAPEVATSTSTS